MQGIQLKDGKGLLSKVENGVRSYSTDGGKTWSEKVPDGVTVGSEGNISFGLLKPIDGNIHGDVAYFN